MVVLIGLVLAAGSGAMVLAGAVAARHRAESAADLAALAAAQNVVYGVGQACSRAASVARAGGAGLQRCTVNQWVVTVSVRIPLSGPLAGMSARATARAGPAEAAT